MEKEMVCYNTETSRGQVGISRQLVTGKKWLEQESEADGIFICRNEDLVR